MQPAPEATGAGPSTARLLVSTLFVAAACFVAVLYATNAATSRTPWVNHDVGYHAYLGTEMSHGSRLYVDLKEDNPPGSPLLLGRVAVLGQTLGLPRFLSLHLFVLLLGVAGLAVLWVAFPDRADDLRYGLVALAYLLLLVRGGFSNNLYPLSPDIPYDFGQREHLFSLLFVPYLCLRVLRRGTPPAVYPFLLLLGFVCTFKPFWPPMIAVVELFRLMDRPRRWWTTPVALGVGMAMPVVALAIHSTDSVVRFFVENIPMYLRGAYTHYDTSYAEFLASPLHWQMVAGGALLLGAGTICLARRAIAVRIVLLFCLVASLAYLSVVHQHKFWSYHTMVYFAVVLVPAVLLMATAIPRIRPEVWRRTAAGALALALGLSVVASVRATGRMLRDFPPLGSELVRLIEPHEKIMFFSMSVVTSYAPFLLGKHMVGPWTVFLDLPEKLAIDDVSERVETLRRYARQVDAVVAEERPQMLVFSPEGIALSHGLTMHTFFNDYGVVPRPGYRRMSPSELAAIDPRLAEWPVYVRSGEE